MSEKTSMGQFFTFAKVLENKIRKEIQAENSPQTQSTYIEKDTEHPHLAWLLGQANDLKVSTPTRMPSKTPYAAFAPRPKPRPSHKFTAEQALAFMLFQRLDSSMADNFSIKDLKSSFRDLAKKTHPDHNGNRDDFSQVLTAYKILLGLFPKK